MQIYLTRCLINNKIYIGQADGLNPYYIGGGKAFRDAIKVYGKRNFVKQILAFGDWDEDTTDLLETTFIKIYNSRNKEIGYNIEPGGRRTKKGEVTKETRNKISLRQKGRIKSLEECNKISLSKTGKKASEKTKVEMSLRRKGKGIPENMKIALKISLEKRSKKILKFINDTLICEYSSVSQAAKDNNIDPKSISRSLNQNKRGYYIKKGTKEVYKFK